jgi:hypothetical protein
MWLKNSNGQPSATLTFMFLTFVVVSLCIVLPMFDGMIIKGFAIDVQKPDNALIIALLAAFVPAYVVRRNTESKSGATDDLGNGNGVK